MYMYTYARGPPHDPPLLGFEASVDKLERHFHISSAKALDFRISKFSKFQAQGSRFPNFQISKGWNVGNLEIWKSRALGPSNLEMCKFLKVRALGLDISKFGI